MFHIFYFIVKSEPAATAYIWQYDIIEWDEHAKHSAETLNMRNNVLIQLEQFLLWLNVILLINDEHSGDDTSSQLQICSARWKNRKNFAGTNHRKLLLLSHSAFIHCDKSE